MSAAPAADGAGDETPTREGGEHRPSGLPKLKPFDGNRAHYKEWQRDVEAHRLLHTFDDGKMGLLIFMALGTLPRQLIQHLAVDEISSQDGYKDIMATLNSEYAQESYEAADLALRNFDRCRRAPGEPMLDFVGRLRAAALMVEHEDKGTKFSPVALAQRLLRQSNLTRVEQRQVLASAGAQWDYDKIANALRLMYADAHLDDRTRNAFGKGGGGSTTSTPSSLGPSASSAGSLRSRGSYKSKGKGSHRIWPRAALAADAVQDDKTSWRSPTTSTSRRWTTSRPWRTRSTLAPMSSTRPATRTRRSTRRRCSPTPSTRA